MLGLYESTDGLVRGDVPAKAATLGIRLECLHEVDAPDGDVFEIDELLILLDPFLFQPTPCAQ